MSEMPHRATPIQLKHYYASLVQMGFCTPGASVLDRLNPLFEGAGRLLLAKKGMTHGGIDTVTPHNDTEK
ncbi:hypothetical protein VP01_2704g7 [Puccinia sorghi]|uniref:Uncharacterized protein n=1 Tax=Puccinia sorghi TaxID=27349 RepID=A0A0L6V5F2_9BASI|nr:hypothetical protein VP01_2704g7 [Puccinia sorghi]